MKINVFWFRRDLRLEDNRALDNALSAGLPGERGKRIPCF
ncbi:MAG: deoxyribodipyrimidine photo-lyase [Bacteroidota bacterium]